MSSPKRQQPVGVIDRLLADPHGFGFFQAVRLLERWFAQRDAMSPVDVLTRRLQFRNSLSLAFPASEIARLEAIGRRAPRPLAIPGTAQPGPEPIDIRDVEQIELTPAFIGLLGPNGALPTFYTELFAGRELNEKDDAGRAFMDVFLHRAVVLFYQAWRKHRLAIQFEADRRNQFLPMVLALAGVGPPALRDRLHAGDGGVSDDTLAYFSGVLQHRPVSASALQRVLAAYFRVPVKLEQFVGRWFALPPDNRTRLGIGNARLGGAAVIGERVWQRDLRSRLVLGPLTRDLFRRFLPGGAAALALRELLTLMTGVTLEYEVRLALQASDVRGVHLGGLAGNPHGARLGWDGFLATRPAVADRLDAGYDLHAIA